MNNEASIPTRYPEDISKLIKEYNKQIAKRYLKENNRKCLHLLSFYGILLLKEGI